MKTSPTFRLCGIHGGHLGEECRRCAATRRANARPPSVSPFAYRPVGVPAAGPTREDIEEAAALEAAAEADYEDRANARTWRAA